MSAIVSEWWRTSNPHLPPLVPGGIEGECYYQNRGWYADWQRQVACDICRRYVQASDKKHDVLEGSVFCACRCQPRAGFFPPCGEPATPERIAAWHTWVAKQRQPEAEVV